MDVSAKITVSGLVQGVGYRYFTYYKAKELGLKGYVRNLYNGNVEVEVEGDRGSIEILIKELKIGPRLSNVRDLKIEWKKYSGKYRSFDITY
ncbi:acylphosphatase [candidate division KSB1 bacterium]|nr:MAG: acylphosphatase [candidate division KSB1 bacterium]